MVAVATAQKPSSPPSKRRAAPAKVSGKPGAKSQPVTRSSKGRAKPAAAKPSATASARGSAKSAPKAGRWADPAPTEIAPARPARPPREPRAQREPRDSLIGKAVGVAFDGHGHDVWGLLFLLVGAVAALGIYLDAAGVIGHAIAVGSGAVIGRASYLVPLALTGTGIMLMRGPQVDDAGFVVEDQTVGSIRLGIGSLLLLVAGTGMFHLWGGQPTFDLGAEALGRSGGAVGVGVGGGLIGLIGPWGAGLVLIALTVLAVIVATGTTVRHAAGGTAERIRPVHQRFGHVWGRLFELRADRADRYDRYDPDGYDVDTDEHDGFGARTRRDDEWDSGDYDGGRRGRGGPDLYDAEAANEFADSNGSDAYGSDEYADHTAVLMPGSDPRSPGDPDVTTIALPEAGVDGVDDPAAASKPKRSRKQPDSDGLHVPEETESVEQLSIDLPPGTIPSVWKLPALNLLETIEAAAVDKAAVEARGRELERALAAHGVDTKLVGMVVGPTVTRYELELGAGVKVARVTSLNRDIAYAMASADVRILAPIPGRQAIGVEVPNEKREVVALGDLLASNEAKKATHPMEAAIGRDINGKSVLINLAKMPHILIAGATGAGKSSCINSLITSILVRATPDQVRLILIDPKRVELGQYNKLPHLLTQVVTNPKKAANALSWAVKEMERRYDLLSEVGVRDIDGYNDAFDRGDFVPDPDEDLELATSYERLPYILLVVDELNDLMMVAARDVEESICRIAQMARAVGIHLVVATQRPSVNVITGVIKANIPARLAFSVSSIADSRVILDQAGAERLVGKGDMLLLDQTSSIAQRLQGAWVSEKEVRLIAAHWRRQAPELALDDDGVQGSGDEGEPGTGMSSGGSGSGGGDDDDDLLVQAMELIVRSQLGSTSMLQRKLRVGFARAGRIMDLLEQRGVVGPGEGSKARSVMMTVEEFEAAHPGSAPGGALNDAVA